MGLKRFLPLVILVAAVSLGVVSDASAGGIRDEPCPTVSGENTNACPTAKTGEFYSIRFRASEEPPCAPGDDKWYIVSGSAPPGLSLNESDGTLSGTPTQEGDYSFYVEMRLPDYWIPEENRGCNGTADTSQKRFTLKVVPGLVKLTIGPESAGQGTTGRPYSLQMTATVPEPKTWSINSGALPPGLAIDASTGLISGTPMASGSFTFEVLAKMVDDARSDTKVLGITIRDPLGILGSEPFTAARKAQAEVGVPFDAMLAATGGDGTYTWSLTSGALPPGLTLADGAIAGTPTTPGTYRFTATVTDAEGRAANYPGRILVAEKLAISTLLLRPGKVGRSYSAKLATSGGVKPTTWKVLRGPLPRGIRFDRTLGLLSGFPTRPGRYRVTFEASDSLGVKSKKTLTIVVASA